MRSWVVIPCVGLAGCGSSPGTAASVDASAETTGDGNDAGVASEVGDQADGMADATTGDDVADGGNSTADAEEEPVYLESGSQDAMIPMCTAPLPDAGFSTLADLPVAQLCAQSKGDLIEYGPPCQGSILVAIPTNPSQWWLFDASTGQLEASGSGDDGAVWCAGGITGFQLPYQCWFNHGWTHETFPCEDAAAADSGPSDAAEDVAE